MTNLSLQSSKSGAANDDGQRRIAYSIAEAAKLTGLGRTTLYSLLGNGRLASVKIGNRRLIHSAALERLVSGEPGVHC
ncbi:helix-turn-helix domain-containing protein [Sphingobium cupriresistens]|uniref:helix-turn-helix domain-containing protein n=1 Tax=Sphingobium cupriresistens TaxID=1132417 RepID=UPI000B050169|nr:helix-turn-helix domain-containing protein [Sphingobium cupriresistens]